VIIPATMFASSAPPPAPARPRRPFTPPSQNGPLDNADKAALCIKAREAFEHVHGRQPTSQAELDAWRHEEQYRATGHTSLLSATKKDFCVIMAHWLDLLGQPAEALNWMLRALTEAHRLAMWKLKRVCAEKNFRMEYVSTVARRIWKVGIEDLTPKQLWGLKFEMEKRPAMPPVAEQMAKYQAAMRAGGREVGSGQWTVDSQPETHCGNTEDAEAKNPF